jgi:hypothetical protein
MNRRMTCILATVAAILSGCASPAPPKAEQTTTAAQTSSLPGELTGSGMVLQKGDNPPVFCLGAITTSYPPQACGGPVLGNWDWSAVTGYERAAGVTWGSYTVTGTWDNGEFVRTREPAPVPPTETGIPDAARPVTGKPGTGNKARLMQIQNDLESAGDQPILTSGIQNGYLVILVAYDNGNIQRELNRKYGAGMIVVRSALKPYK